MPLSVQICGQQVNVTFPLPRLICGGNFAVQFLSENEFVEQAE